MASSNFGCPHCGRSNPIDAQFCAFCGTNLQEVDTESLAPPPEGEEPADSLDTPQLPRPARRPVARPPLPGGEELAERSRRRPRSQPTEPPDAPSPETEPSPGASGREPTPSPRGMPPSDLLAPLDVDAYMPVAPRVVPPAQFATPMDAETRRQLRQLFAAEVPLTEVPPSIDNIEGHGLWRRRWLEWSLLAVLILVLLLGRGPIDALPHIWPGVAPVYAAIEALPPGSVVLVDWAYDPATAGEMNLVARPVIEHLLVQEADLVVVSQLPLGPATARRLIATAQAAIAPGPRQLDALPVEAGFLPGGAATLPLLGQAPTVGVPVDLSGRAARTLPALARLEESPPALALVIAAGADAVQRWLEQVQPLNGVPTVAVTSAAADPALRPYVDSGQLIGIVGGYSGGLGYHALLDRPLARAEQFPFWQQIRGHTGALIVLMAAVILGNLTFLGNRRNR